MALLSFRDRIVPNLQALLYDRLDLICTLMLQRIVVRQLPEIGKALRKQGQRSTKVFQIITVTRQDVVHAGSGRVVPSRVQLVDHGAHFLGVADPTLAAPEIIKGEKRCRNEEAEKDDGGQKYGARFCGRSHSTILERYLAL